MASKKQLKRRIAMLEAQAAQAAHELSVTKKMLRIQRRLTDIAYGTNCETCKQFVTGYVFATDQISVPTMDNLSRTIPGETHFRYQPCGHEAVL